MKVVFNCSSYSFHRDYYENIAKELIRRGHIVQFLKEGYDKDADFTITADEAQKSMGGKCVWIGHSFDAKGAMWNDPFYLNHLQKNTDIAFVYSEEYEKILSKHYTKPIYVSGMAKLDGLFGARKTHDCILYAPTFNKELSADNITRGHLRDLADLGEVMIRKHPAFTDNELSLYDCLKKATIVISDYSSVGMESIVLNLPTILVKSPDKNAYKTFPKEEYICNRARAATIEVDDMNGLINAVKTYIDNPYYLGQERLHYGRILSEYQNSASKRTVDLLEELL